MPCRSDYDARDSAAELKAELDRVTKELCRTQGFVYRTYKMGLISTGVRQFGVRGNNDLNEILASYRAHREKDKERAINEAKGEHGRLASQVAQVIKLGGVPGQTLAHDATNAELRLAQLQDSDPLETLLY